MPFPATTDPDYCPASLTPAQGYSLTVQWFRCPQCTRPIAARRDGSFYPHVSDVRRARRRDRVQESLMTYGIALTHRQRTAAGDEGGPTLASTGSSGLTAGYETR